MTPSLAITSVPRRPSEAGSGRPEGDSHRPVSTDVGFQQLLISAMSNSVPMSSLLSVLSPISSDRRVDAGTATTARAPHAAPTAAAAPEDMPLDMGSNKEPGQVYSKPAPADSPRPTAVSPPREGKDPSLATSRQEPGAKADITEVNTGGVSRSSTVGAIGDSPSGSSQVEVVRIRSGSSSPVPASVGVFLRADAAASQSLLIVPVSLPRAIGEGRMLPAQATMAPVSDIRSLASLRTLPRSQPPSLGPVEPKWVIDQLVSHLRLSVREGVTEVRVQLRPEHLGNMVIRLIKSEDGSVSGTIYVANQDVKNLLQSNISLLHTALQQSGAILSGLDLQVADGFGRGSSDHLPGKKATNREAIPSASSSLPISSADEEVLREVYGFGQVNISA